MRFAVRVNADHLENQPPPGGSVLAHYVRTPGGSLRLDNLRFPKNAC